MTKITVIHLSLLFVIIFIALFYGNVSFSIDKADNNSDLIKTVHGRPSLIKTIDGDIVCYHFGVRDSGISCLKFK